jgi:hypothetical protein
MSTANAVSSNIWTEQVIEYMYQRILCRCGILVVGTTVVATELYEANPGFSITNSVEAAAAAVCNQLGIDPAHLVFIEHYPAQQNLAETFDRVFFDGFRTNEEGHVLFQGVSVDWDTVSPERMHSWIAEVYSGPPLLK